MNIAITGGCGFIGSHIYESLIEHGYKVKVIDNLSTGSIENLPKERRYTLRISTELPLKTLKMLI